MKNYLFNKKFCIKNDTVSSLNQGNKKMFYIELLRNTLRRLVKDERGASAIEYALIAALIAMAIIVGAEALGFSIRDLFQDIADDLDGAISS